MGQPGKVCREADSDVMILSKIVGIVYLFPNHHRESWFTRRSQSSLFIVTVLLNFHPCYFDEEASNDSAIMGFGPSTSQESSHVSS